MVTVEYWLYLYQVKLIRNMIMQDYGLHFTVYIKEGFPKECIYIYFIIPK